MVDPEVLDKIKRACSPQKAIYDIANYVETDVIPPINEATNTANAAAAQANSAYNRATDALNTANSVAADVSRSLIDLNAGGDGSTVTLNAPRNTGNPATAPLPVADATKAGVMNSATYVNLQNLNTRVSSLENQTTTYIVSFTNDNPTQDEINNAYKTAYPTAPFPPIDGTTVIDSTRQLYYRWVKNGAIWLKTTGFVISQFTNETAGTIKGSTVAGQIQAETDGTGSLVGYDQIKNDITANATGIQTLTANLSTTNTNVTNLDGRVTAVEGRVNNSLIALSSKSDATGVTITGTKQAGQPSETQIPVASATQSGIVTPTMFNAWNQGYKPFKVQGFRPATRFDTPKYIQIDNGAGSVVFARFNTKYNAGRGELYLEQNDTYNIYNASTGYQITEGQTIMYSAQSSKNLQRYGILIYITGNRINNNTPILRAFIEWVIQASTSSIEAKTSTITVWCDELAVNVQN